MTELIFSKERVIDIAFGNKFYSLILTENKRVYGIGNNSNFQLGTGTN